MFSCSTVQNGQRKHLLAAHRVVLETIGDIAESVDKAVAIKPQGSSPPPPPKDEPATHEQGSAPAKEDNAAQEPADSETQQGPSPPQVRIQTATTRCSEPMDKHAPATHEDATQPLPPPPPPSSDAKEATTEATSSDAREETAGRETHTATEKEAHPSSSEDGQKDKTETHDLP